MLLRLPEHHVSSSSPSLSSPTSFVPHPPPPLTVRLPAALVFNDRVTFTFCPLRHVSSSMPAPLPPQPSLPSWKVLRDSFLKTQTLDVDIHTVSVFQLLPLCDLFSGKIFLLLRLLFLSVSTHPDPLPPQPFTLPPASLRSLRIPPPSLLIISKSRLPITFDRSPLELFIAESQVFYLCCVTIQLWKRPHAASQHGCLCPRVRQRWRKANLSSIHHPKIALHLLIIAFFR